MSQRTSGILLPIASLPGSFGIGDFGPEAYRFVDWLVAAGQSAWAMLPLGVPDDLGSPFDSPSAFALNWMLVSPESLRKKGLVTERELRGIRNRSQYVRYSRVNRTKRHILGLAWWNFQQRGRKKDRAAFAAFKSREREWLDDFSVFSAIKDRQSGAPWHAWPDPLKYRREQALRTWVRHHKKEVEFFAFGQWIADEQWRALKDYANRRGVSIVGNMPHFVTYDSVDVWRRPELFSTGRGRILRSVAGAPPDGFNRFGQYWGNPLYVWPAHRRQQFRWWRERMAVAFSRHDVVVLDHFRGFSAVWEVRAHDHDARKGLWTSVPGKQLFTAIARDHGSLPLIAEDLGDISEDVNILRDLFAIPGMRILLFGVGALGKPYHWPPFSQRSVAFTGTHDNHTSTGWLPRASKNERRRALHRTRGTAKTFAWDMVACGMASESNLFIAPLQDVLGLSDTARMNTPNSTIKNWQWVVPKTALTAKMAERLWTLTAATGRIEKKSAVSLGG